MHTTALAVVRKSQVLVVRFSANQTLYGSNGGAGLLGIILCVSDSDTESASCIVEVKGECNRAVNVFQTKWSVGSEPDDD